MPYQRKVKGHYRKGKGKKRVHVRGHLRKRRTHYKKR